MTKDISGYIGHEKCSMNCNPSNYGLYGSTCNLNNLQNGCHGGYLNIYTIYWSLAKIFPYNRKAWRYKNLSLYLQSLRNFRDHLHRVYPLMIVHRERPEFILVMAAVLGTVAVGGFRTRLLLPLQRVGRRGGHDEQDPLDLLLDLRQPLLYCHQDN